MCGTDGSGGSDLLLMTATTAMTSTTSTIHSNDLTTSKLQYQENQGVHHNYDDFIDSSNTSTLKLKNRTKIEVTKSDLGVDIYKNLNNNNNNNHNQWV